MLSRTIKYVLNDAVIMLYSNIHRTTEVVRNHYKCCSITAVSKLSFYLRPSYPHTDLRKLNE